LIQGAYVKTPFDKGTITNEITNGVEIDSLGRQIAYWVEDKKGIITRLPAYGAKTGRRLAWLIYGTDRRIGEVRGMPFISCMFYMLKELDRYRDSEQRAAYINSILAMWIEKTQPVLSSLPMTGGASRKGTTTNTNDDSTTKTTRHTNNLPGMVFEEMAVGEKVNSHNTQRPNVNFNAFQEAILNVFFYVNEIPPEIGMLQFKNNFSASRQADNEFKVYLKKADDMINGAQFYQPIYETYLYQSALLGTIKADSLIQAWGNYSKWMIYGAWVNAEWTGLSRPSVDILKDVNAMILATQNNFATADFACRRISNMSYKGVINQRKKEMKFAEKSGITVMQPESNEPDQDDNSNDITNARLKKLENKINLLNVLAYDKIEKQEGII
jgi:capsid protein